MNPDQDQNMPEAQPQTMPPQAQSVDEQTMPTGQAPAVEPPVQPDQTDVTSTPPPSGGSRKMLMIIGAVIILLILAAVGIFAYMQTQKPAEQVMTEPSPTPEAMMADEMSEWISDTDTAGISFKYPPNWRKDVEVGGTFITAPNGETRVLISGTERKGMSAQEAIHDYLENYTGYGGQGIRYTNEKEITINSITGWVATVYINALNQTDIIMYLPDPNNTQLYQGLWITNVKDDTESTANQILSTFRFGSGL